jgi:threonine dehydrogenase-like Zn-dependent dehydrogenase
VKALVYVGWKEKVPALQERPKPGVTAPTDAIVKMTLTTICGTDLHILKGDVATCEPGRILGHEGVGVIEEVGAAVTTFKPGDQLKLKDWAFAIARRSSMRRARTALARRLAIIMHAMLRDGSEFVAA